MEFDDQVGSSVRGDIMLLRTYRMHGPWGVHTRPAGMREMEYQLTYWLNFLWLGNGFLAEGMVHNVDVCCWAKDAWPVAAQGQGGRLALPQPGQWASSQASCRRTLTPRHTRTRTLLAWDPLARS